MNRHLAYLQDRYTDMLEAVKALVLQESPTSSKPCCDQAGRLIQALYEANLDCRTRLLPQEKCGDSLLVEWGQGDRQVMLVGHFDTVHPLGTLAEHPFTVTDGKIYGPGIYDMKCGIIQALFALMSLERNTALKDQLKVVCYFNSDEEIGSPYSRFAMLELGKACDLAFVMEPSFGPLGAIKTARSGVGAYKIGAHGRAAHAGNCPEEGISAIEELCRQVLKIQALNAPEQGVYVNCGLISGGTARNTVPEFAQAVFDVRVRTVLAAQQFKEAFYAASPVDPRVTLSLEGDYTRPPMEQNPKQQEVFNIAKALMRACCGQDLPQAGVGGGSDGNILAAVTTVLDGMGAVGGHAHSPDEFVIAAHLVPRTALLAALLEKI